MMMFLSKNNKSKKRRTTTTTTTRRTVRRIFFAMVMISMTASCHAFVVQTTTTTTTTRRVHRATTTTMSRSAVPHLVLRRTCGEKCFLFMVNDEDEDEEHNTRNDDLHKSGEEEEEDSSTAASTTVGATTTAVVDKQGIRSTLDDDDVQYSQQQEQKTKKKLNGMEEVLSLYVNQDEEQLEEEQQASASQQLDVVVSSSVSSNDDDDDHEETKQQQKKDSDRQQEIDEKYMKMAIELAQESGGEDSPDSAHPKPTVGAILVVNDEHDDNENVNGKYVNGSGSVGSGRIIGRGVSDYNNDAIVMALKNSGLDITPLDEWCVQFPTSSSGSSTSTPLRDDIKRSTLYVTLEPINDRYGTISMPSVVKLIILSGISRIVIGRRHPIPEYATIGAKMLHDAGLNVKLGNVLEDDCSALISKYSNLANDKLRRMARKHYKQFQRPLGFLHCSVIDSDNIVAFANNGNAFGTSSSTPGGQRLSFRALGSYEIAPPPEAVWANNNNNNIDEDYYEFEDDEDDAGSSSSSDSANIMSVDFEDEDDYAFDDGTSTSGSSAGGTITSPMMPWYEQADGIVVTFPRDGNGPPDDNSLWARLNGIRWLATHGSSLPSGVERIVVMDATDLKDLPIYNNDHNTTHLLQLQRPTTTTNNTNQDDNTYTNYNNIGGGGGGVDVESLWRNDNNTRKPTRLILRRGLNEQARVAATSAAMAAKAAAKAAKHATNSIESGDATEAALSAIQYAADAEQATQYIRNELQQLQTIKNTLENMGTIVEVIEGGEPVDVMEHLGKKHGMQAVVWRAGCWGERGVRAVLAGAFQWISAHLAVDAIGGKFWQLMLAENAVQAACGPERKVKVFADQEDISLEYCDQPDADKDCVVSIDGRPVRHIRLDCRVALVDNSRKREFYLTKTKQLDKQSLLENAPWFF